MSLLMTNWQTKKLGDIGESIIGLTYSPNDIHNNGLEVLRSSNIQNGRIDLSDMVRVTTRIPDNLILKNGDILVCARNGSRRLIGKNVHIDEDNCGKTFGAFMCVFRTDQSKYVKYLFQSEEFQRQVQRDLGPTINQVTSGNLNSFKFNFPEKPEQERIVSVLEVWDEYLEKLERKIALKEELKKGLMQQLLNGKLHSLDYHPSWSTKEFDEVFITLSKKDGIKSSEYLQDGKIPIFDQSYGKYISGYTNDEGKAVLTECDLILFGDHSRVVKYIDKQSFAVGNDGIKLFTTREGVDVYFGFMLLSRYPVPNTGYNRHFKYISDAVFDIPDLDEQLSITKIIKSIEGEIEINRKKLNEINLQKKYLLKNLITGTIRTPETLTRKEIA